MPPRAIWSGTISFGLVNVPVRMYGAIEEHDLHFHFVHEPDTGRIGYEKVCKKEGKPVPAEEIVKAFEIEKGEYVYMRDEDFAAAQVQGAKTIEITDFVPFDEIDSIYFERTYYLGPQTGAEKVYALLARAMGESGLAGIAKYVMRDRQHLGCLRVRDGAITLEKMHFADEIRPVDDIAPSGVRVSKQELQMAAQLIESFTGPFDPEKYEDTYRDALCDIIKARKRGDEVEVDDEPEAEEPTDLMSALRASVEAAQAARAKSHKGANSGGRRRGDPARGSRSKPKSSSRRT